MIAWWKPAKSPATWKGCHRMAPFLTLQWPVFFLLYFLTSPTSKVKGITREKSLRFLVDVRRQEIHKTLDTFMFPFTRLRRRSFQISTSGVVNAQPSEVSQCRWVSGRCQISRQCNRDAVFRATVVHQYAAAVFCWPEVESYEVDHGRKGRHGCSVRSVAVQPEPARLVAGKSYRRRPTVCLNG